MRVTGGFKGALERQIDEAVRINNNSSNADIIINNQSELNAAITTKWFCQSNRQKKTLNKKSKNSQNSQNDQNPNPAQLPNISQLSHQTNKDELVSQSTSQLVSEVTPPRVNRSQSTVCTPSIRNIIQMFESRTPGKGKKVAQNTQP